MQLLVSFRGAVYPVAVDAETTVANVKTFLAAATGIPAPNQRLLHKAFARAGDGDQVCGLLKGEADQVKVLLVGTKEEDLAEVRRKDRVLEVRRQREHTASLKPSSQQSSAPSGRTYTFGSVKQLDQFPDSNLAKNLLLRLREDIGIIEVMRSHKWFVQVLTELHPAEKTILGFNKNMGQEISIRLRTDRLDGFRHYRTIVKVLLHELVHMVHSDHNEAFHTLNSQLNREYDLYSQGNSVAGGREDGSRVFSVDDDSTGVSPSHKYQGGTFVLGGNNTPGGAHSTASDIQRDVILAAAEKRRLEQWEQELVDSCNEQKEREERK
ncbi:WLM domain-containing protein [Obelidium mucronatum]|nr:WLM domain-containing protein [Obelidium mucronatum]